MKLALAIVLATAIAEAAPRRAPSYADVEPGPDSDVDDNAFAQDLRAAFGKSISRCTPDDCSLVLAELWCALDGVETVCHATDRLAGHVLTARGKPAQRLVLHLRNLGSDLFDADRWAAYAVSCRSEPQSPDSPIRVKYPMHGYCVVEMKHGDDILLGGFAAIMQSKLGGNQWTGRLRVHCTVETGPCEASSAPVSDPDDWQQRSSVAAFSLEDRAVAEMLWGRSGALDTIVDCRAWPGQDWDGGLVEVIGCGVTRR